MVLGERDGSLLLATLLQAVPQIRARLVDADAWNGLYVSEPDAGERYLRLVCVDDLVRGADARERHYRPAIHLFEQRDYEGRMHDHRWPIAVLPLDLDPPLDGARGVPLYEMPWRHRDGTSGVRVVCSGEPWAIEACSEVLHAVRSLRPHLSIVLSDVTEAPRRENRMRVEPMPRADVAVLLARAQRLV